MENDRLEQCECRDRAKRLNHSKVYLEQTRWLSRSRVGSQDLELLCEAGQFCRGSSHEQLKCMASWSGSQEDNQGKQTGQGRASLQRKHCRSYRGVEFGPKAE